MTTRSPQRTTITSLLKRQINDLIRFNYQHSRAWHMPVMAAIATSFPIFLGAYFDQLSSGLVASLGAMVFLNLPYQGTFFFRMTQVLACSFGFVACYAVGLITHLEPRLTLPLLFFVTFWVALFGRYFRLTPPAGTFILMAAAIALFMPIAPLQIPFYIGLIGLGCLFSGVIACIYTLSLFAGGKQNTHSEPFAYRDDMMVDSALVATTVTASLAVALLLDMSRPYWVTVSCFTIITGMTVLSIWTKQLQRVIGTFFGMAVAWGLLLFDLNPWQVAIAMLLLVVIIETLVVRNYALAIAFVTPLTILMAEYSSQVVHTANAETSVIIARFWDTLLGCVIGLLGGMIIHSRRLRPSLHRFDQRLARIFRIS